MMYNYHLHTSQITIYYQFYFISSGSVILDWVSFLLHISMYSVPGAFCSLKLLIMRVTGIQIFVINAFNEIPSLYFLSIGYIPANKVLLGNTWSYIFMSKEFIQSYIFSDPHITSNPFFWNILSDWYLRSNEINFDHIIHCFIILSVYFSCSISICHCFVRSYGGTNKWKPLYWNVFSYGSSCTLTPSWNSCIGLYWEFILLINICGSLPIPNIKTILWIVVMFKIISLSINSPNCPWNILICSVWWFWVVGDGFEP